MDRCNADRTGENRVGDGAPPAYASCGLELARTPRPTSAARLATYGRTIASAANGGSRLRVAISNPSAAADSGLTYPRIRTTSATSRAPSPAHAKGSGAIIKT